MPRQDPNLVVVDASPEPIALARTPEDIAYVRGELATLEELARGRSIALDQMRSWAGVDLPRATYMLPDGELRYARDWWRMFDDAGGIDGNRALFEHRYRAAGGSDVHAEWCAYVAGLYGACLRVVTPETIVAKAGLVERLSVRSRRGPRIRCGVATSARMWMRSTSSRARSQRAIASASGGRPAAIA